MVSVPTQPTGCRPTHNSSSASPRIRRGAWVRSAKSRPPTLRSRSPILAPADADEPRPREVREFGRLGIRALHEMDERVACGDLVVFGQARVVAAQAARERGLGVINEQRVGERRGEVGASGRKRRSLAIACRRSCRADRRSADRWAAASGARRRGRRRQAQRCPTAQHGNQEAALVDADVAQFHRRREMTSPTACRPGNAPMTRAR